VALDLPQRHRFEHVEARARHSAERFPALVLDQSAHANVELQRDLVSGNAHAGNISDSGRHRNSPDALLPPLRTPGLRRYQRSAIRNFIGNVSAQPASLVGARHGLFSFRAHVQSVLSRRLPHSARIQLGDRRGSPAHHVAPELHRILTALGSTRLLGHHGRLEHRLRRTRHGQQNSFPSVGRQCGERQRPAALLRPALHDPAADGDVLHRYSFLAHSQGWRPLFAFERRRNNNHGRRQRLHSRCRLQREEISAPNRFHHSPHLGASEGRQ